MFALLATAVLAGLNATDYRSREWTERHLPAWVAWLVAPDTPEAEARLDRARRPVFADFSALVWWETGELLADPPTDSTVRSIIALNTPETQELIRREPYRCTTLARDALAYSRAAFRCYHDEYGAFDLRARAAGWPDARR